MNHQKMVLFLFFIVFYKSLYAIEVPESCLSQEKIPCIVKESQSFQIKGHKFNPTEEVLLKIYQFSPLKMDLMYGTFRVQVSKKSELSIDQLELKKNDLVYYKKNPQGYNVMKTSDLDYMTLVRGKNSSQDYYVEKYELLNKKEFALFVSHFYVNKTEYGNDLKSLSKLYKSKLEIESKKEIEVSQNSFNRKIASEEAELKRKEILSQKIKDNREKTRQQFFQRTFQQ